jgi:phage I-like protein
MMRGMKTDRAHLFSLLPASGEIPQWIHLMPAGTFKAVDGRGPWTADLAAVVAASLPAGGRLPIDQDHATDLAAKQGLPAPARGWIVAMDVRADGIWGEVEWTETGKALLADRSYRGISPVFKTGAGGKVDRILRAALTNDPAIAELNTLMQANIEDNDMDWKKQLASLLGMEADASDDAVMAAVKKLATEEKTETAAIAKAAGLDEGLDANGIVLALAARQAQATDVEALRGTVSDLKIEIASLKAVNSKSDAERLVDAEILAGKPIKAQRDTWIQLMAADPEKTKVALAALPSIKGDLLDKDKKAGGGDGLDESETNICQLMGIDPEKFAAARKASGVTLGA